MKQSLLDFNSPGGFGEHYNHPPTTTAGDRLGNLIPPMQLSRIELQPQTLIVHFPQKAIKALGMLVIPKSSDLLALIPERL